MYDLQTVTAADFTVQLDISKDQIQKFYDEVGHTSKFKTSPAYCLKQYLIQELQQKLKNS